MTLLLPLLFALATPAVPPAALGVVDAPTAIVSLTWNNNPPNWVEIGVSNRLYCWRNSVTNVFEVGQTNVYSVSVASKPRSYYQVRPVLGGLECEPTNVIGVPPKTVGVVHWQKNGKDQGVLESWTNAPAEPVALYRLRIQSTNSYEP